MSHSVKTPLYDAHLAAGGKIIEFAGWLMPVEYSGILPEHNAVRNDAGLFDVSHMGEVDVKGPQAEAFVQNLVTNDVSVMANNQVLYALMCYENGGTVDDLLVYKKNNEHFLLVINAANIEKDFAWMNDNAKGFDITLDNISDNVAEVALQGPKAQDILQRVTAYDLNDIKFFTFAENIDVKGIQCLISRTGYTGEDGFEIYTTPDQITALWDLLLETGREDGLLPTGLGCRDTLRFEATLPLYGQEISQEISPVEAGLNIFVKLDKPNFIGKDALVAQKTNGPVKKVIGFELLGKGIPRHGYPVAVNGEIIGEVTTGYMAPTVGKTIGLAVVKAEFTALGTEFDILIRNKPVAAKVISKKFLDKKYKK